MSFAIVPTSTVSAAVIKIKTASINSDVHPGVRSITIDSNGDRSSIDNDDDVDDKKKKKNIENDELTGDQARFFWLTIVTIVEEEEEVDDDDNDDDDVGGEVEEEEEEYQGRRCNDDVLASSANFQYVVFTGRSIPSKTRRYIVMLPCALGLENGRRRRKSKRRISE
jgi:hypothetical protein